MFCVSSSLYAVVRLCVLTSSELACHVLTTSELACRVLTTSELADAIISELLCGRKALVLS